MRNSFLWWGIISSVIFIIIIRFWPGISYESVKPEPINRISVIVVPHHHLVADVRAAAFKEVAPRVSPNTIVLVSPNHISAGHSDIQTSAQSWETGDRVVEIRTDLVDKLSGTGLAVVENQIIKDEAGIWPVIPDIAENFPKSKLLPITIKPGTSQEKLQVLYDFLDQNCFDCLLIASVDFSHYMPTILGELHDKTAIRALKNQNSELLLERAEVDSPETLYLASEFAKNRNHGEFIVYAKTSSGVITGITEGETTTHVTGWYQKGRAISPEPSVTFIMGGDMMFARGVHKRFYDDLSMSLEEMGERLMWGTDASIINLEGAVTDKQIEPVVTPGNFTFIFPPETPAVLDQYNITHTSLANNHTNNNGYSGIALTQNLLEAVGLGWFGGPGESGTHHVSVIEGHDLNLVLIGIHTLITIPDIIPIIEQYAIDPKNRIIVMPHWGLEYQKVHSKRQQQLAEAWIDSGADAVIGAHPHVIQDVGVYKGRPIVYSLGNFLFDQTFSQETQEGILVAGEFHGDSLQLFALPVVSRGMQPRLMASSSASVILDSLYQPWQDYKVTTEFGTHYQFPLDIYE